MSKLKPKFADPDKERWERWERACGGLCSKPNAPQESKRKSSPRRRPPKDKPFRRWFQSLAVGGWPIVIYGGSSARIDLRDDDAAGAAFLTDLLNSAHAVPPKKARRP